MRSEYSYAVDALPSRHPFIRLIRHAWKWWAYSTPAHKESGTYLIKNKGFFNKQYFRFWGVENKQVVLEKNYIHNKYMVRNYAQPKLGHISLKTQQN